MFFFGRLVHVRPSPSKVGWRCVGSRRGARLQRAYGRFGHDTGPTAGPDVAASVAATTTHEDATCPWNARLLLGDTCTSADARGRTLYNYYWEEIQSCKGLGTRYWVLGHGAKAAPAGTMPRCGTRPRHPRRCSFSAACGPAAAVRPKKRCQRRA